MAESYGKVQLLQQYIESRREALSLSSKKLRADEADDVKNRLTALVRAEYAKSESRLKTLTEEDRRECDKIARALSIAADGWRRKLEQLPDVDLRRRI